MTKSLRYWPLAALAGFFAFFFAAIAPGYITRFHIPVASAAGIYSCFVWMLVLAIVPGIRTVRPWIDGRLKARGGIAALLILLCQPYLLYAAGTGDFRWNALARLLGVAGLLLFLYGYFPVSDVTTFCWQDLLVALWLVAALLMHQLAGIWNVPVSTATSINPITVNIPPMIFDIS